MPSFVNAGRAFENECHALLKQFRFHLDVVGKAGDGGVDLKGAWMLDDNAIVPALRVLVQCKNTKNKISCVRVRELEGSMSRWNNNVEEREKCVGFLMSNNVPTANALESMVQSRYGLGFIVVVSGRIGRMYVNPVVQKRLPHFYTYQDEGENCVKLFWRGKMILPL